MACAINLKCLNNTGAAVRALWREAEAFEDEASMHALGYPPHLTLAVYDTNEPASLIEAVEDVADRPAQEVSFNGVQFFDLTPLVLWAAPEASDALRQFHHAVHRRIDPARCRPEYRPGNWVPHCTLAMRVGESRRQEALRWARTKRLSFTVTFDAVDCARFYPVEVLRERRLR